MEIKIHQVRTLAEIDALVYGPNGVQGTHVRRRNAKRKLIEASNAIIGSQMVEVKSKIRALISEPESAKRELYSQLTNLEMQIIS